MLLAAAGPEPPVLSILRLLTRGDWESIIAMLSAGYSFTSDGESELSDVARKYPVSDFLRS